MNEDGDIRYVKELSTNRRGGPETRRVRSDLEFNVMRRGGKRNR